ncbi:MAG: hypothetical protein R2838_19000 [Caldilineaceae bacterium]
MVNETALAMLWLFGWQIAGLYLTTTDHRRGRRAGDRGASPG